MFVLQPPRSRSTPSTPRAARHKTTPKSAVRHARSQESRKRLMDAKRAARQRMADEGGTVCDVVIVDRKDSNKSS